MDDLLASLNKYSDLITAAATVALAALTWFLLFENRGLRKAGSAPQVVAYLLPHPDGNGAVELVLANVGKGPAFNITFVLSCDEGDFDAHDVLLRNDADRMPLTVLPQDEKLKSLFGIGFKLFGLMDGQKIAPLKPFNVSIEYHDALGRKTKTERTIDIKQFAGLKGLIAKSNEHKVAQSLEKIEQHLGTIARQSARFNAFVDVTQLSDQYVQKTKGDDSTLG
jgi:hypothetical protein